MNLKRLFSRKIWTTVKTKPFKRREVNPITDYQSEWQRGVLIIEQNQFGDERARWSNGYDSTSVDLAYAKAQFNN